MVKRRAASMITAAAVAIVVGAGTLVLAAPARPTVVQATPARPSSAPTSVAAADEEAQEQADEAAEKAQEQADEAAEKAQEQADEAAEKAQEQADEAREAAAAPDDDAPTLTELRGTVERQGNGLSVGGVELGLGPRWYREQGEWAPLLAGLVGQEVTFLVDRHGDGDAAVFAINGTRYRPEQGRPPWAGGPKRLGIDPGNGNAAGPPGREAGWVPPGHAK
jgi:hypothetical protein